MNYVSRFNLKKKIWGAGGGGGTVTSWAAKMPF